MKTVLEVLQLATELLQQKGIRAPRREAENLLCDVLGWQRMQLYLEHDRPLVDKELDLCRNRLARRAKGEPLAYIHGTVEFFGCSFAITPAVIIPRPETEILADKISKSLASQQLSGKVLWDICCGSGCLGISLKKKHPELQVALSDISLEALEVARENAAKNEVEVEFLQGDLLAPFKGRRADYLVSNPPYIAAHDYEALDMEVKQFEPKTALLSGPRGDEFYERFAQELPAVMQPGGQAWFEIGTGQGKVVEELFNQTGCCQVFVERDWSGHDRFTSVLFS